MKKIRHILAILMTVTMITSGGGMDGFAALTYAAEDQEASAVTQEQEVSENDAVNPSESESDADEPIADIEAESDDSAMPDEAELVHKTLKASKVKLEGFMPEDAKATATDASDTKAVRKLEAQDGTVLAAYDITIKADGAEYQPDSDNPILVQISDKAITKDSNLTIWHIKDNGKKEQIDNYEVSKGKVTFEATGFSVYAIVPAPELLKPGELFTLFVDGKYFMNTLNNKDAFNTTTNVSGAADWYLETVPNNNSLFYLCTNVNGAKKYVKNTSGNLVGLVDKDGTAFEITKVGDDNKYYFKMYGANKWLQWSGNGQGIRFYTDNKNATNSQITITYKEYVPATVDLDGATYGIAYHNGDVSAAGMMSIVSGNNKLTAKDMQVRPDVLNDTGVLLVAEDSEITEWTFYETSSGSKKYYITAQVDGNTKYLTMNETALTLADSPDSSGNSEFTATPGTGANAGKYQFSIGNYSLTLSGGTASGGFVGVRNEKNGYSWLNLVEKSDQLNDDDFTIYTAAKKSISEKDPNLDPPHVDDYVITDGTEVVLYTRIWNTNTLKYDYYVVNHDGTLMPAFDSGDTVQWYGSQINTALWKLTEHYENGEINGYYELQNTYSSKYIAPKLESDKIVQNGTIGINLAGRENGDAYSTIVAWDNPHYAYAGLKVEKGRVVNCPMDEAEDFYFAIVEDINADTLTTVPTIDNNEYGISLKMSNYKYQGYYITNNGTKSSSGDYRQALQTVLLGGLNTDGANMVKRNLVNGYPVSNKSTIDEKSLQPLFTTYSYTAPGSTADAGTTTEDVNHLFLKSTYNESGYFEFDSTQNFAQLQADHNFKVYDQLVSSEAHKRDSMKHGQFFPYNKLGDENNNPVLNLSNTIFNVTDTSANELPDTDPRKGESLFNIPKGKPGSNSMPADDAVDYFFGMEMSARFTQTPSGKDAWGHDIIFEFSGDDDMWFFVDDVLVLDMGGIHSAMRGSVNFRTGKVIGRDGQETTLKACFRAAYQEKGLSAEEIETELDKIFDGEIFKDYTTHTMKMFYMERGAGSSNLYMRLNLTAVKDGHALLSKEISGGNKQDFRNEEYPFQVYFRPSESEPEQLLEQTIDGDGVGNVTYRNKGGNVKFEPSYSVAGNTYQNVFFLKLGETADINFPKAEGVDTYTGSYRIVECGVDERVYDDVTVNNGTETVTKNGPVDYISTYTTSESTPSERPIVKFNNHVNPISHTLTITKVLRDAEGNLLKYGTSENPADKEDSTVFKFRLSLANEGGTPSLAYQHPYYVRGPVSEQYPNGLYCKWVKEGEGGHFEELQDCDTFEELMALIDNNTVATKDVKFVTSPNGAIDNIPAGFNVELRDLMIGTQFKVEEKDYEVPVGYTCKGYSDVSKDADPSGTFYTGSIPADGEDPHVWATNKRGWGIRAEKVWSDNDFVTKHNTYPYFAVYVNGTLLEDTVRQLDSYNYTKYFFEKLEENSSFSDYEVREVKQTSSGFVPVNLNNDPDSTESLDFDATPIGESSPRTFAYIPTYTQGEETGSNDHIRIDTVTNTRTGGIKIIKKDLGDTPLEGAVFDLIKKGTGGAEDTMIGTFTSNEKGFVTTAYLKEGSTYLGEGTYELTEKVSPRGYQVMAGTIEIVVDSVGNYNIKQGYGYTYVDGSIPVLTIQNRPFTLKAVKVDEDNNTRTLSGAHFALYKGIQVTSHGTTKIRKDYYPLEGFEDLTSDSNGIILGVNEKALAPGTYYLVETKAPDKYKLSDKDVRFTISNEGVVTVDTVDETGNVHFIGTLMTVENKNSDGGIIKVDYTINVPDKKDAFKLNVIKQVDGGFANPNDEFEFTVDSLTANTAYDFQRYEKDGSEWTEETGSGASGTKTANAQGKITFKLKHNEKIAITLPSVNAVHVIEAASDYTTSYVIDEGSSQSGLSAHVTMNDDKTVTFTNTKGQVAPTGYSSYLWPLIWMLLLGMFMWTAMTYMRKRRSLDGYAMEAAGIDSYDGFDAYDDTYDDYDAADSNADMDFAVNESSETSYEAFDWKRIVI